MYLWDCITKENQERITKRYKERFGIELVPPTKDKRAVQCEVKLESLEEIDKIMRQKPGRVI